jgi:hypothetical protein
MQTATAVAEGKYLYCIITCDGPREFSSRGIGERGDPVHMIYGDGLAAVVSDSPIVEYESSRRNMMAHTRVLEEVMQEHTLLPVRFGIIAPDEASIARQLVGAKAEALRGQLGRVEGKVELGLKAFWYEEVIFAEIVEGSPEIRRLRDSLAGRSPEETYYERIRLGELIEGEMARRREADAARILDALRPLADEIQVSPPITDRMVVNAAFLVGKEREAAFDAAVRELDAELGKRMLFKVVGPVPPYNFVSLTIGWD